MLAEEPAALAAGSYAYWGKAYGLTARTGAHLPLEYAALLAAASAHVGVLPGLLHSVRRAALDSNGSGVKQTLSGPASCAALLALAGGLPALICPAFGSPLWVSSCCRPGGLGSAPPQPTPACPSALPPRFHYLLAAATP